MNTTDADQLSQSIRVPASDTEKPLIQALTLALTDQPYRASPEKQLQAAMADRLQARDITVIREHPLGTGAIDLFLPGSGIGIEVKTKGSTAAVIRQLHRYATSGKLKHLVLATTNHRLDIEVPTEIAGIAVHHILLPLSR